MKLLKVIENGTCDFCQKETEVCQSQMENNRTVTLCWKDLQKLARMNLKEKTDAPRSASS